ncbi:hypothetical protein SLA2020_437330 [Shorea laevis]
MLYARSLYITWGNRENWTWNCFKETSDENIEVAKLSHVCWLDVRGKLNMSELSPDVVYEIVYVVKLTRGLLGGNSLSYLNFHSQMEEFKNAKLAFWRSLEDNG